MSDQAIIRCDYCAKILKEDEKVLPIISGNKDNPFLLETLGYCCKQCYLKYHVERKDHPNIDEIKEIAKEVANYLMTVGNILSNDHKSVFLIERDSHTHGKTHIDSYLEMVCTHALQGALKNKLISIKQVDEDTFKLLRIPTDVKIWDSISKPLGEHIKNKTKDVNPDANRQEEAQK
jgi:hypothetical protein